MMKVLSDEWYAAEAENYAIRNQHREAFWAAVGVTRDHDVEAIDIAHEQRLPDALSLLSQAGSKLADADLAHINAVTAAALQHYGLMASVAAGAAQSISLGSNSPSDFKAGFFVSEVLPIFNLAT